MTSIDVVETPVSQNDPADHFNNLMSQVETQLSVIEAVRALNPAFVAKVEAAISGAARSRTEANAQHYAIQDALADTIPDEGERRAVTNWFVYVAMANGYSQAHRLLTKFVEAAGDPATVPTLPEPSPQLAIAHIPGLRIGPWKSPKRARASRAVASLGNPHGAGRIFKAALETFSETSALLSPTGGMDPQATNLVRSALENDAIDVTIVGGSDELLRTPIAPYDGDELGCSVAVDMAASWRRTIEEMLANKQARLGSVQYWSSTLEKLGFDPSNYRD